MSARTMLPLESEQARQPASLVAIGLAALVLALAVHMRGGNLSPLALTGLGISFVVMLLAQRVNWRIRSGVMHGVLFAIAVLQLVLLVSWTPSTPPLYGLTVGCFVLAGLVMGLSVAAGRNSRWPAYCLFAISLLAGILLLGYFPRPGIDVLMFQDGGAAALLKGYNPYAIRFADPYSPEASARFYGSGVSVNGVLQTGYPYTPLSLLLTVPAYLLGDVRYASLACMVGTGGLLALIARGPMVRLAPALFLFTPITPLVLWLGWTEPHVVFLLALTVVCRQRWPRLLPYAFGMLLVSKQYMPAVAPLGLLLLPRPWRTSQLLVFSARAALAASIVTLPFILWNPHEFWNSAVVFQLRQPFRGDALSFLVAANPRDPSRWMWLPFAALGVALLLPFAGRNRYRINFPFAVGFALMLFFSLNKQAFANYYYLVIGALCVAAASSGDDGDSATSITIAPSAG